MEVAAILMVFASHRFSSGRASRGWGQAASGGRGGVGWPDALSRLKKTGAPGQHSGGNLQIVFVWICCIRRPFGLGFELPQAAKAPEGRVCGFRQAVAGALQPGSGWPRMI